MASEKSDVSADIYIYIYIYMVPANNRHHGSYPKTVDT